MIHFVAIIAERLLKKSFVAPRDRRMMSDPNAMIVRAGESEDYLA